MLVLKGILRGSLKITSENQNNCFEAKIASKDSQGSMSVSTTWVRYYHTDIPYRLSR